jgi:hypothetical protein
LKAPQKSLKDWTQQKWRTKSGKPSTQGKGLLVNAIYQNQPLSHYLPLSMQLLQGPNGQVKLRVSSSSPSLKELQRKQRGIGDE